MRDHLFHIGEFERNEIGFKNKKTDSLNNLNSTNVLAPDYDEIERDRLFHMGEFERNEMKTDGLSNLKNLYTAENKQQLEHLRNDNLNNLLEKFYNIETLGMIVPFHIPFGFREMTEEVSRLS